AREAPARAVIGDAEIGIGYRIELLDLRREAALALGKIRLRMHAAVVHLGHDREHRNLEHDRVQPRPLDRDVDLAGAARQRADMNEPLVELEEAEQIDEIALEEAPAAQVIELAPREAQTAQLGDLAADVADVRREIDPAVTAFEAILDLSCRKMMQHDLHHRE